MADIRFAVIGTGAMAATMMSTFASAGVRVTAVGSRNSERANQFALAFGIPFASTSLDAILQSNDVDAIYIANSPADHANTAIAGLEAGKAVLCEKPMGLSSAEAVRVVEVARATKGLFMEGLWALFLPSYRLFFDLAREQHCGEPRALTADFGFPVNKQAQPRLLSSDTGGVLRDRGIYLIAMALKIFGPAEAVAAQFVSDGLGTETEAYLQLSHRTGGHSCLAASFTCLMSNTASLSCSNGWMRLESPVICSETVSTYRAWGPSVTQGMSPFPPAQEKLRRILRQSAQVRRIKRILDKPASRHAGFGVDQYVPQLKHFVGLIKSGAEESDIVPLQFSLDVHQIIDRARADHQLL